MVSSQLCRLCTDTLLQRLGVIYPGLKELDYPSQSVSLLYTLSNSSSQRRSSSFPEYSNPSCGQFPIFCRMLSSIFILLSLLPSNLQILHPKHVNECRLKVSTLTHHCTCNPGTNWLVVDKISVIHELVRSNSVSTFSAP